MYQSFFVVLGADFNFTEFIDKLSPAHFVAAGLLLNVGLGAA
jgi:hypothetical protein